MRTDALTKAYALKIKSAELGAPMATQVRLDRRFQDALARFERRNPELIWPAGWEDRLGEAAERWWAGRPVSGPGVDW